MRIWYKDPRSLNSKDTAGHVVLGGTNVKYLARMDPEKKNKNYLTKNLAPVCWYLVEGIIRAQKEFLIAKIIPDMYISEAPAPVDPSQQKKGIHQVQRRPALDLQHEHPGTQAQQILRSKLKSQTRK